MLKLYDYLEAMMEVRNNRQWYFETRLNYFASDVMETLEIKDPAEIAFSLERAFQACKTLNIPFSRNFKKVFRFDGEKLFADWKISALAGYLIIINCNPSYPPVANAQLFFAMNQVVNK
ncbi:MAG TPA: hypothetical protein VGC65_09720 [Bacteroidia bacterium]|jgi:hypothetical protein